MSKEERKKYLKRRVSVICSCKRKQPQNDRAKYGTSRCDGYSFSYSVALVLSNALFQYLADAKQIIIREDWDIIEKHAQAIQDFSEADTWDLLDKEDLSKGQEYLKKEKAFREAMFWLAEEWQSLWW